MMSEWKGRRVLIAGGLGFIGSNLAIDLVEKGASVVIVDSLIPCCGGSIANVQGYEDRLQLEIVDLRDRTSLTPLLLDVDLVFLLSAQSGHLTSMQEPVFDLDLNCRGPLELLDLLRTNNPSAKVIFTSTRQVYGRVEANPVDETHPCQPTDINGVHKLACENYLRLYFANYSIPFVTLRLTNTYGPRMNLLSGTGVVPVFLRRALERKAITLFGTGLQRRDFNYVGDVVEALELVALSPQTNGRTFNLGHHDSVSLLELARMLDQLSPVEVLFQEFPQSIRAIDIGDYQGDYSSLRETVGWTPKTDLFQGLRLTLDFYHQAENRCRASA